MSEFQIRKEAKIAAQEKNKALHDKMKVALSLLSKSSEGQLVLRYIMYEGNFLSPLMYETPEGVNKDVMIANEAKRRLYLSLRAHMDRETIMRIELPEKEETNA